MGWPSCRVAERERAEQSRDLFPSLLQVLFSSFKVRCVVGLHIPAIDRASVHYTIISTLSRTEYSDPTSNGACLRYRTENNKTGAVVFFSESPMVRG